MDALAIKKAWGEVFAGGMVDAFNCVEQVERRGINIFIIAHSFKNML